MKEIRIMRRYFDFIKSGQKTLEVRVGYNSIRNIQKSEQMRISTSQASLVVKINDIRIYPNFHEMLQHEAFTKIIPDATSSQEALATLTRIYPPDKEKLGVYVFEVELAQ